MEKIDHIHPASPYNYRTRVIERHAIKNPDYLSIRKISPSVELGIRSKINPLNYLHSSNKAILDTLEKDQ
ncbi:hypothetical protein AKJ52_01870 [candidate division MSBL1 archaeon SCGC-AAA382C18]|uniref:Uncharacterized protein n=1 Tax=candidate division MSBL1 archaeon SCGC-AAA382C18 TaxID=1698281 RepID=A0A133VJR8_9EURY|nr:hypothetical protein AKJ52_01870 [candidate division MSBL1 archaeon SCGC-AAA382C18]